MTTLVTNPFQGVLYANRGDDGWAEKYHLPDVTFGAAAANFLEVVKARSYLLADGAEVAFAVVRQSMRPPPLLPILAEPIPALRKPDDTPYWLPPDNHYAGPWIQGETADGRSNKRLLRMLADDEIGRNEWAHAGIAIPAGPAVPPADPRTATREELIRYYLMTLRDRTRHGRFLSRNAAGDETWSLTPFERFYTDRFGKEDIGRRWLRVSWEPGNYSFAPPFSPCGTVVMVVRSCYEAPCRFFADGVERPIRWYVAAEGAELLPFPTIFWPYAQMGGYTRGAAPGERTPYLKSWYSRGYSAGDAPGVAPTGSPELFLGLGSATYNLSLPTPPALIPGCDMPSAPLTIDNFPLTLTISLADHLTIDEETLELTESGPNHAYLKARQPESPPWDPAADDTPYKVDYYATSLSPAPIRVGMTMRGNVNGSLSNIDGAAQVVGDVIIFNSATANAGVWRLSQEGGGSQPYIFERVTDFDESDKFASGVLFYVRKGTVNSGRLFTMYVPAGWVFETDYVLFSRHTRFTKIHDGVSSLAFVDANGDLGPVPATQDDDGVFTVNGPLIANGGIKIDDIGANPAHGFLIVSDQNPTFSTSAAIDLRGNMDVALHGCGGGTTDFGVSIYMGVGAAILWASDGSGMQPTTYGYVWFTRGLAMWNGAYYEEGGSGLIGPGARALGGIVTYPGSGPMMTAAMVESIVNGLL